MANFIKTNELMRCIEVHGMGRRLVMTEVMVIPVVVYVVYNKNRPIKNRSDKQIYGQIDRLNKDYPRLNEDY